MAIPPAPRIMPTMPEGLPCPVCKRPVAIAVDQQPPTFPFCSARCRTIDLGAWASGNYVVPGTPVMDDLGHNDGRDHA